MIRSKINCRAAPKRAQCTIIPYAVGAGASKLREARDYLGRLHDTVGSVAKYQQNKRSYGAKESVGPCCTYEDAAYWLRRLPAQITRVLENIVVTATEALVRDGLPPNVATSCSAFVGAEVHRIVTACEKVRVTLKDGIEREYALMRMNASTVLPLLDDAVGLIDNILERVKPRV